MRLAARLLCAALLTVCWTSAQQHRRHDDDDTAEIDIGKNTLQSAESGGGGRSSSGTEDSDERKTLSQQVADGKYGLIQRELFSGELPAAPGVLSYDANPEVPRDTADTLGGLAREEIWLAEDHLLVLRGGKFEPDEGATPHSAPVPPIDDYRAPARQVKIPSKPRVPPPFPVQLQEGGPVQILEAAPAQAEAEAGPSPTAAHRANKTDIAPGQAEKSHAGQAGPVPARQGNSRGGAGKGQRPPGPAPTPIDEDDPSIYYPPPYSFFYPKDNSSAVPPGPLVPGIVLPPPPDFFGPLDSSTTTPRPMPPPSTTPRPYLPPPLITTTARPPLATVPPQLITPVPHLVNKPVRIPTQAPRPVYFEYFERGPPVQQPVRAYVTSTAVPLRAYYNAAVRPAQFYFYEEDPSINEVQSPRPPPRYIIATVAKPKPALSNFEHHIQRLTQEIQRQRKYGRYRDPRPVYQYSFGYENQPTARPPLHYTSQIQSSVGYERIPQERVPPGAVTPNPVLDHAYFTKDNIFDDMTKKYFTVFGQKLTTPLPPVLRDDINVNYRRPIPPANPQSELVGASPVRQGADGAFISYRLPGDGAHFYFLTPQLAGQQPPQHTHRSDSTGYYYPPPSAV